MNNISHGESFHKVSCSRWILEPERIERIHTNTCYNVNRVSENRVTSWKGVVKDWDVGFNDKKKLGLTGLDSGTFLLIITCLRYMHSTSNGIRWKSVGVLIRLFDSVCFFIFTLNSFWNVEWIFSIIETEIVKCMHIALRLLRDLRVDVNSIRYTKHTQQ